MTNEEIINGLAQFFKEGDTLDNCPVVITSREQIEDEEAELVRFTFGEYAESCVAILYDDDTLLTPTDWQYPIWDYDENWKIEDSDWMDSRFCECVNFNGMPKLFI